VGRLRARAVAMLVELDAAGTDTRRRRAERDADVRVHPAPGEGMSTLAADLPTPEAAACREMVDRLAGLLKADGDPRPIGQLRAGVLADLILRPWDTTRPAVTAQLTVLAPLAALTGRGDQAGEVGGQPITATVLRALLTELDALGLRAPAGGSLALALTDPDGTLRATCTPDQLARLARRGCRTHPGGDCGCPLLDRPPAVAGYTPSDAQKLFVKTRDRTCRFANCDRPVGWAAGLPAGARAELARCGGQGGPSSVLPVPLAPPAEDLRPRLGLPDGSRRHPDRHHPRRYHPHPPPTRIRPTRRCATG
jgi:hypothetical protein